MAFRTLLALALYVAIVPKVVNAQNDKPGPSRQEKLRGSITAEREWWDVQHYHLTVRFMPETKTIEGSNVIRFKTIKPGCKMQIDLQEPLKVSSVKRGDAELKFEREGNVYWAEFENEIPAGQEISVVVEYSGVPKIATRPPWDGGVSWDKDKNGNPFIVTTCQGIGASIWWPNKDHGYDEPDHGMRISLTVPEGLKAVSNGRLKSTEKNTEQKTETFHWEITQPINNYCINANIGDYVNFSDKYDGEFGTLDVDYWVLRDQREKAEKHFREVPRTIKAFEHWFGKYPFYEDSYKLVAVPYAGMEHQSSVTYGNGFKNGYRGRDLSSTGVGFKFDFIIVHESGHEWFGNNVSMKDVADMWIHESFTNYSENLFVEYHFSEKEAQDYVIGCRALVQNDRPIIGEYGLNREGSGDMYYKGGNMLHTMRHILSDDDKWRQILRGINSTFWHQIVTTQQIESYISEHAGIDYSKFFDQYLRDVRIPKFVYAIDANDLYYHFDDVVDGFEFPADVAINGKMVRLNVNSKTQVYRSDSPIESCELDRNFYYHAVEKKELDGRNEFRIKDIERRLGLAMKDLDLAAKRVEQLKKQLNAERVARKMQLPSQEFQFHVARHSRDEKEEELRSLTVDKKRVKGGRDAKVGHRLVHIVLLNVVNDLSKTQVDDLFAKLKTLHAIEQVHNYEVGRFCDLNDPRAMSEYEIVLSMRFSSEDDYHTYQKHPIHLQLKNDIKSYLEKAPLSYDFWAEK